jgi:DNA-binding GntR family transcriptional regulator
MSDAQIARLEEIHCELVAATPLARAKQPNEQFHWAIYEAGDLPLLLESIQRLWEIFPWRTMWLLPGRSEVAAAEHEQILEAIRARDAQLAGERMRRHILHGYEAIHVPDLPGAVALPTPDADRAAS